MPEHAFFVTQVGADRSPQRQRADDVTDSIVRPAVQEAGLRLVRADLDPTPGKIDTKMLKDLLEAKVVIADLTDRNPNVYYELALAHAYNKPVVSLIDDPKEIAFDVQALRCITVPKHEGGIAYRAVVQAGADLRRALAVALGDGYEPNSPITEVASARSLAALTDENPLASEVSAIRETLDEVRSLVKRPVGGGSSGSPRIRDEYLSMQRVLRRLGDERRLKPDDLRDAITPNTGPEFDAWVGTIVEPPDPWAATEAADPWQSSEPQRDGGSRSSDEPPF